MILGLGWLLVVQLLVLGCFTGFLAGLLGIGGGMVMVPFMTLLLSTQGVAAVLSVKMAIATSMSTILFTSISSVRAHHKRGAVRWDLVRTLAPVVQHVMKAAIQLNADLRGAERAAALRELEAMLAAHLEARFAGMPGSG